jgi:DNA-binding transcriptional LysR family regulator
MLTQMSTLDAMTIDISSAREPVLSARSLRYLHEVEAHGGVRAAADALGINPSVISRQVGQLEREYEVVLLERSGRRAVLTEIGMSLVEHFRESTRRDADMLAQLEDFKSLAAIQRFARGSFARRRFARSSVRVMRLPANAGFASNSCAKSG